MIMTLRSVWFVYPSDYTGGMTTAFAVLTDDPSRLCAWCSKPLPKAHPRLTCGDACKDARWRAWVRQGRPSAVVKPRTVRAHRERKN